MLYHFDIFAENFYFYIQDNGTQTPRIKNSVKLWEIFYDLDNLAYHYDGVLLVGTVRDMDVPVIIEVFNAKPSEEFFVPLLNQASHAVQASFMAYTGNLIVQGPLEESEEEKHITIPAGSYQVMIYYNNLNKVSKNKITGEDTYHLIFYPGEQIEVKVLKRFLEFE